MTEDTRTGLEVLRDIELSVKAIGQALKAMLPKPVAPARELDGPYGNPEVKFMPRDWTGPSFKHARMSECPPELLDLLAETFDYFAEQSDEKHEITAANKPVSAYRRKDAARARGWAKRKREGWVGTPAAPAAPDDDGFGPTDSFGGDDGGF